MFLSYKQTACLISLLTANEILFTDILFSTFFLGPFTYSIFNLPSECNEFYTTYNFVNSFEFQYSLRCKWEILAFSSGPINTNLMPCLIKIVGHHLLKREFFEKSTKIDCKKLKMAQTEEVIIEHGDFVRKADTVNYKI